MRLREIFRLEFAIQSRSRANRLFALVIAVLAFLFVRGNFLADAQYADFYVNSPYVIAATTVFCTLFWFLLSAPVAGRAGARDPETGFAPLIYTTPVSRFEYLAGRFLAALLVNAAILLSSTIGILVAVYGPGVDPTVIGPFRPVAWLGAIGFIALPNAFIGTAIQFSWSVLGRRTLASYIGSLILFFITYGGVIVVGLFIGRQDLAAMLDVFGHIFITSDLTLGWTPHEKNTRLIALEGILLGSRLLWVGIGLGALAVTWARFRFAHHTASAWWSRILRRPHAEAPNPTANIVPHSGISVPDVHRPFGPATFLRQLWEITRTSFRTIAGSWTGLPLLIGLAGMVVLVLPEVMHNMGTPFLPRTEYLLSLLTAPITSPMTPWVVVPLLIVFYAGELVWRERGAGLGEIADAAPVSEWVRILGIFLGLALVLALWMLLLTVAGLLVQVRMGFPDIDIGLMLRVLFGLQLPEYLLFALPAIVLQGVIRRKYVGHLVVLLAYVFILFAPYLGIEHRLLIYGATPGWSYTDMRGFGTSLGPWGWFMLYWGAWGMLLVVLGRLFWVRGMEGSLHVRLRSARGRLDRSTAMIASIAGGLVLLLGGFIFYNTNVLNHYSTSSAVMERQAEYERLYGIYADVPQPEVTGTTLRIELYPDRQELTIRGSHIIRNGTGTTIDSIHVATVPGEITGMISFDRAASAVVADDEHGHRIYMLEQPLLPGDSTGLHFEVVVETDGFRNSGLPASIGPNSVYFRGLDLLPTVGYRAERELLKPGERRKYGLPSRPIIPHLTESGADITGEDHTVPSGGDGVRVETIIGTVPEHVAVAPGALQREWMEDGRRYFHFRTGTPVGDEYAFFAAGYEVIRDEWTDPSDTSGRVIPIQIYYQPAHGAIVPRLLRSARASMSYYSREFGPYPYDYVRLIESPGTGVGAHAEPTTINYSEAFSRFNPDADDRELDLPFAVMAHEMAHLWGVPYAFMEGAPLITESFAWYAAMGVVEETYGADHLRRLLRFFRQPYPIPPIRQSVPLLRAADPWAAYRKGPFALHGLDEYMGGGRVNTAFRRLIEKHRSGAIRRATSLDLYHELEQVTPDSLRYLLRDLFAENTIWDLETERASVRKTESGEWLLSLEIRARKVAIDSTGTETEIPMDEWVQIGAFAETVEGSEFGRRLALRMHRIRSGRQTIRLTLPERPADAGVDPYHLLIDPERYDNVEEVEG